MQQKQIANVNRKLESVEYLMKIEEKNKRELEEKYEKQITKMEKQLVKFEADLEISLKELNEKESKIFEIQKNKLNAFKQEIQKYENVYKDLEEKYSQTAKVLDTATQDEDSLFNRTYMIYEDYLSYNHELVLFRKKMMDMKQTLTEIEKSYPKEFQFLLEDVQYEKEMKEIVIRKSKLKVNLERNSDEIDNIERSKNEIYQLKEVKKFEVNTIYEEIKRIDQSIENNKKDSHLQRMEEFICENISDIMIFEKMKIVIQNYYIQKNFDVENELNIILTKNLAEKLKEMKNEFIQIKNEKLLQKLKAEKAYDDVLKASEISKNDSEVKLRKIELEKVNNEINMLELNCKKKETLFNKYIIVLRNKCNKSSLESYYEMNPALIIENDFEDRLKDELFRCLEGRCHTEDERIKNKNLIEIYFKELINREKILQNFYLQKKKQEETIGNINKEIEKMDENIFRLENELITKRAVINDINVREKFIQDRLHLRNRSLTNSLEQMGEQEFENYIKANSQILKNMKKVYGNKAIDRVFKSQKQKFLENIIIDHTFKKERVNEYIVAISKYEASVEQFNNNVGVLENQYHSYMNNLQEIIDFKGAKLKEHKIVKESKDDLREKIEHILKSQIEEIELEKKQLQLKYNFNYFVEKIKDLSQKIESTNAEKELFVREYQNFKTVLHEKEQKLYLEDLDLKNNLISLTMGVSGEEAQTHLPFKIKSFDLKLDEEEHTELEIKEDPTFEDIMKLSAAEYKDIDKLDNLLRFEDDERTFRRKDILLCFRYRYVGESTLQSS
jgi:hypothetical protein